MKQGNDNNPHLDSSTIQQWVRQAAQQKPSEHIPKKEKAKEEIRKNRMEWIDFAAAVFCLILSVLLLILNVVNKFDSTLLLVIALLLPLLTLLLYYTGILDQDTHSGTQLIAILLFLSSIAAISAGTGAAYVSYLHYSQFILPCVLTAVFFLVVNRILKHKRNRYLALLIMIIWLPFYTPAFVILTNITLPSLHTEETSCELKGTDYHSDGEHTVRVKVEELDTVLTFPLPKAVYDRVSYGSTAEVTLRKGLFGIDYAKVKLYNLEDQNSTDD